MNNYNFNIFSNGLSTTLAATSPYSAAKIIADKLTITHDKIKYVGDKVYTIGGHSFNISI